MFLLSAVGFFAHFSHGTLKKRFTNATTVVAIVCAVRSGRRVVAELSELPVLSTMLSSFLSSMETKYFYSFYLAFDESDPAFGDPNLRDRVSDHFSIAFEREFSKRFPSTSTQKRRHRYNLVWVQCNYTGKPAWSQNDAAMAAFYDGADYIFRTNDDTLLPNQSDWTSVFVQDLRSRKPIPNLGVVGPKCSQGNTKILTHDFTHRTHIVVHGFYYPRMLPTWWSDDWITHTYHGFSPPLLTKRADVQVVHLIAPQRYAVSITHNTSKVLQEEIKKGRDAVFNYALQKFGVKLQHPGY